MMKCNMYPMTILTRYALNSFDAQRSDGRFGLVQLASSASDNMSVVSIIYACTKRYNDIFG